MSEAGKQMRRKTQHYENAPPFMDRTTGHFVLFAVVVEDYALTTLLGERRFAPVALRVSTTSCAFLHTMS